MNIYSADYDRYLATLAHADLMRTLDDHDAEHGEWAQAQEDIMRGRY